MDDTFDSLCQKKVLFVVLCYCVQWHWHDLSPVKWQSYLRDLVVGLIWTCFNTIHMIILGKQYLQRLNNAIWFFCQKDITEVYVGLCVYNCYPTWLTILFKLFSWVQCNLVFLMCLIFACFLIECVERRFESSLADDLENIISSPPLFFVLQRIAHLDTP